MIKRLVASLKRLIGRLHQMFSDKAEFVTAIGAMLIPSDMMWVFWAYEQDIQPEYIWWPALIVFGAGIILICTGWVYVVKEGQASAGNAIIEQKRRVQEEQRRKEEHTRYLVTLQAIAKRLGVKPMGLKHEIERVKDTERLEEQLKKDFGERDSSDDE